jgi:hypothetical protein
MPGRLGVQSPPAAPLLKERLHALHHVAVVQRPTVEHQQRAAGTKLLEVHIEVTHAAQHWTLRPPFLVAVPPTYLVLRRDADGQEHGPRGLPTVAANKAHLRARVVRRADRALQHQRLAGAGPP